MRLFLCLGLIALLLRSTFSHADPPPHYVSQWPVSQPTVVTLDPLGNVYVGSRFDNRVSKFTSTGTPLVSWTVSYPWHLAADTTGDLYAAVADIWKYSYDGTFLGEWPTLGYGPGQLCCANGVAPDNRGFVYVGDVNQGKVLKYTDAGTFVLEWTTDSSYYPFPFFSPGCIAVDHSGIVYVLDTESYYILEFTSNGTFLSQWRVWLWAGPPCDCYNLRSPSDIALDDESNVYIADRDNSRIVELTSDGVLLTNWGTFGSGDGEFDWPSGVAVDRQGYIYVADTNNNRVQKFAPGAIVPTVRTSWGRLKALYR